MFSGPNRGWDSLSTNQKLMIAVVAVLVLYGIAVSGGQGFLGRLANPDWLIAATIIVFVAFPIHEFAHAAMAVYLGDETPRWQGRLTLEPMAHVDPLGAILIFVMGFGWAKPVQWNPANIRVDQQLGSILVAIVGPLSNLLLAAIALLAVRIGANFLPTGTINAMWGIASAFASINVLLFVFNMIPVPPLDGSHILFALLPGDTYALRAQLSQFGIFIILGVGYIAPQIIWGPTQLILSMMIELIL